MSEESVWRPAGNPDEPRDQRRDLGGGYWAEVGPEPDGPHPGGWSWMVVTGRAGFDQAAGGDVADEDTAKAAVAGWEAVNLPRGQAGPGN